MEKHDQSLLNRFFSERSVGMKLKLAITSVTTIITIILAYYIFAGFFTREEARIILYAFYIIIFLNSFFAGFGPGIFAATASSLIAIAVIGPGWLVFSEITFVEIEIFPFVALYFLVAVTVDWFRENIEKLKIQLAENERLYVQATQMEKLALAGEIAAGIAHEIRNPLTVVHGYIQLMGTRNTDLGETESYNLLLDEIKRANQIISDFLRFSRPNQPLKTMTQIHEIVESACTLMSAEAMRHHVRIVTNLTGSMPRLYIDQNQMLQVFINLISNALQAMPHGGVISISSHYSKLNKIAVIRVKDNGVGIAGENLQRIFTPFYTTREQGTGLGLSISQTIILANDGQVAVNSTPGEGTEFILTFPAPNQQTVGGLQE